MEDHLVGARAAVLGRLWGAFRREPLPGLTARDGLTVTIGGHVVEGPDTRPFDRYDTLAVRVDGRTVTDPAELVRAVGDSPAWERLAVEVADSVRGVALARAADRPEPLPLRELAGDLATLEQEIVDGHPLHPLCRTRTGLSDDEIRAYAPEYGRTVALAVYDVPPDRWLTTGDGLPPRLVVHPWQRDHVLGRYPFLRDTGERIDARPLMSLRTLAVKNVHLKTSVDVQMTSAVRTVSAAAVHNGPVMSALLAGRIAVFREPAAGIVLVDGEPERRLAMVRRQLPDLAPDETALPFAVLAAPGPGGRPRVAELVDAYGGDPGATVAALAEVALPPLIGLLHHGIALEAHGQNLLLAVARGRPTRILYRDMGGVRVHEGRLARAGVTAPRMAGDIATDDETELRTKLVAAVVSTVFAEIVATLRDAYGVEETSLWRRVGDTIEAAYRGLPGTAAGDRAAMLGGSVPLKAMTAMRLSATPLEDIWTPIANPMAR